MDQLSTQQHTALKTLEMVARHHAIDVSVERIVHDYAIGTDPIAPHLLLRIAHDLGFKAKKRSMSWDELTRLDAAYPVIARLNNGNSVVLSGLRQREGVEEAVVVDPLADREGFLFVRRDHFEAMWQHEVILLKRRHRLGDEQQPFGLRWFIPEFMRQGSAFAYVAVAGLSLHAISLVTPLFFQIVIDKVLVHNSEETLTILGVGVTIALLFESILGFLRNYLLLHTTNKMDIRLSSRTFSHLLSLPLAFFENSSAGVIVKHMQQAEVIRNFMTGKLFSTVMDTWALFIFLPALLFYSVTMTLVVLLFSGLVAVTLLVVMPLFQREIERLYAAEGKRQSQLVEVIHGMRTVKSLALEPGLRRSWSDRSAQAITMQMRVGKVSISAQAIIGFLEKLLSVVIVWLGAVMVFQGALTVGELVAIQMLAGRVSSPLVQLVSLINEFQKTAMSVRMLGEIMNHPPEQAMTQEGLRPPLHGKITLEGITFHYPGMAVPALNHISLTFQAGSMVGIVGRSGSGKSTLLRLLQGLYLPQQGTIRFDQHDIRELDFSHLRHNLGVVLQESFFFRGTVRENIAQSLPGASFSQVVTAAHLAGADEFIQHLPQGYETLLEENAGNLSGGQKQRLAIARAVLSQPPILIFDEATSALDPESESIVQDNMSRIAQGRTVVMVSHRLSTLVEAEQIFVLDQGAVVGRGTHAELLAQEGIYRHLWYKQHSHER
ncbi:MAG: peptidase domain-containing ABC transporter [Magnetococcales bacterium]|nr:peptidase domain-containing ABC transporter [Magnetococcales bacterium]